MNFEFLFSILGPIILLFLYLRNKYTYWNKQDIPTAKGTLPIFGNTAALIFLRTTLRDLTYRLYNEHKDASMIGFYHMTTPVLFIRDPTLIKAVIQTSFSDFRKNLTELDSDLDPLLTYSPFFCDEKQWSINRKRATSILSGMKLQILCTHVFKVCEEMNSFIDRKLGISEKLEIELKDLFCRFTAEVLASTLFSVKGHAFEDEQHPMSFYNLGKQIFTPDFKFKLLQVMTVFSPLLSKLFRQRFVPKEVDQYFRDVVRDILRTREQEETPKNDFLHLIVELARSEDREDDIEFIAGNALSMFVDSFDTTSTTLVFVVFRLASEPNVQEKLRQEVLSVLAKHNGVIALDSLKEMTYMTQVISESQRMHPVAASLLKGCTQDTVLEGPDGLRCKVKAGCRVMLPLDPIHNDPKYWSNPETFDPDRFNAERKKDIEKYTFMPFGEGPRYCTGMNVASTVIKVALASILMKYTLKTSLKTQLPLKLVPGTVIVAVEGGVWVSIERI